MTVAAELRQQKMTAELLAPAGDWEAMRSAVANGADAVYFGLDKHNARHRAKNFTLTELPEVMHYLHSHNVRGYVTFNTLFFSDELADAMTYVAGMVQAGVDALLVQDLGMASLIHELCPSLMLHGSTQMTLTEPRGINMVRELGIGRVVLARELSMPEVERICKATTVPVEVFVHGALCVSYSGQCLTSEALGGRSANRGQCAQACRLPYDLIVDGKEKDLGDKAYLLSPQDLAAYDLIGPLLKLGVASFKIEGRLKSAHYVAATCQTYRQAMNAALGDQKFAISPQQKLDLEQSFSRGFSHGFLDGVNHQELVHARFPKARGTRIGTILKVGQDVVLIELDPTAPAEALKPGDGLVFDEGHPEQDEQGGRVFTVRRAGPRQIEVGLGYGDVNPAYLNTNAIVWKTDDPAIRKRLEHSFARDTVVHREPVHFTLTAHVGGKLTLIAKDGKGHQASASWDKTLETAKKFPVDDKMVREQLDRLGDTPYELGTLKLDAKGGPMVPKSVLNDLRRQVMQELISQRESLGQVSQPDALDLARTRIMKNPQLSPDVTGDDIAPQIHVLARTLEQVDALLGMSPRPEWIYCDFEDIRRYKDAVALCRKADVKVALATLRIVKPQEEGTLKLIADHQPDAVLVRNLAAVSYYHDKNPDLMQIGDYAINIANEITAAYFAGQGLMRLVPSYDLNWQQLRAMLGRISPRLFEVVIHQHMPMFHMEHCVFAHTLSSGKSYHDCGRPCEHHQVDLRDRVGEAHPLIPDVGCRNTVFNAQAQTAAEYVPEMLKLGVRQFRIELLRERGEEAVSLIEKYRRVLAGQEQPLQMVRSLRVLNQLGVTRGTLGHD